MGQCPKLNDKLLFYLLRTTVEKVTLMCFCFWGRNIPLLVLVSLLFQLGVFLHQPARK